MIILYAVIVFLLSIYSYSQIDLNLTLSSNVIYQFFQKQMIILGYYNRPFSAGIFTAILILFFAVYLWILKKAKQNKLRKSLLYLLIGISVTIPVFSYPGFSHDIFNYMFDARIVTKYQSNPYFSKALDFPADPWIRFMHWVHRTYPYGPVWLAVTIPFSFLGFGKFVLTLINFKLMFTAFYLLNILLIYRISQKIKPQEAIFNLTFFALNPLVIIESLISPHNEVVMLTFLLLSVYIYFIEKKFFTGIILLIISAGVKFVTGAALPLYYFLNFMRKKITQKDSFVILNLLLIAAVIAEIISREPYPWYFVILLGSVSLPLVGIELKIILISVSMGALLRYIPFLYTGSYTSSSLTVENWLFIIPLALSVSWVLIKFLKPRVV